MIPWTGPSRTLIPLLLPACSNPAALHHLALALPPLRLGVIILTPRCCEPCHVYADDDSYETSPDSEHVTAYFKPSQGSSGLVSSSSGSTYSKSVSAPAAGSSVVAVKARVLVASDGYFSRVRKQCMDDGPPTVSHCSSNSSSTATVALQEALPPLISINMHLV